MSMSHHIVSCLRNSLRLLLLLHSWRNFIQALPIMEIHHLGEGSTNPEDPKDEITLFSMRFCPYAQRTHLVLNAKNKTYNTIYINLVSKPKWYTDIFPAGRVPALRYKGEFLYESLLLADFIDEEFPDTPLYPTDPVRKLKDKMLIEKFGEVATSFRQVAMDGFKQENFSSLISAVNNFEQELVRRNTKYFGGNERPMMVDYMIWPWYERIPALVHLFGDQAKVLSGKFPRTEQWVALMLVDPSVTKYYLTPEQHTKHFRLRKANDPAAFNGTY